MDRNLINIRYKDFEIFEVSKDIFVCVCNDANFSIYDAKLVKRLEKRTYEGLSDEELFNTGFDYDVSGEDESLSCYCYFTLANEWDLKWLLRKIAQSLEMNEKGGPFIVSLLNFIERFSTANYEENPMIKGVKTNEIRN